MSQAADSAPEAGGSGPSETLYTYRCPVCGHSDGVSFEGAEKLRIDCSHCTAALELRLRSEETERVSVQVDTGE